MKGFERPEMIVLDDESSIPDGQLVARPQQFTHEVVREQPYWFRRESVGKPNGTLAAGAKVLMIGADAECADVVDERGLRMTIPADAVRKL